MAMATKKIFGLKAKNKTEKAEAAPPPVLTPTTNGHVDQDLFDAADQGDLIRVRALLDAHKDDPGYINGADKMGATALHIAAMGTHLDVCEYLIHEGAKVDVVNSESTTPLHYMVRKAPKKASQSSDDPPSPLSLSDMLSGRRTQYIRLLDLVLEKGANIDAQSVRAETPLHQACNRGNEEAVRWLLANNADLHLANKMKETPLATLRGAESHIAEMLAHADLDDATATARAMLTWGFGGHGVLGYAVAGGTASERTQPTPRQAPDAQTFTPLNDRCVVAIACGSYVTAVLTSNAEVFVWGRGKISSVSGMDYWYLLGNGPEDKEMELTPVQLDLPPIAQVSLGVNHGAVVTKEGEVMTWGFGGNGQLGHGDKKNVAKPTIVAALGKNVIRVVCCETHTIVLTKDYDVWTWGGGEHGQLGHGDVLERLVPTKVSGLEGVIQIAGAPTHSACVTASGSVYVWGTVSGVPLTAPARVSYFDDRDIRIARVACGYNLTVAVSEMGDTYTWGSGRQLGHADSTSEATPRLVEGLKDKSVRRISCGSLHILALTDRGHIYAIGKDTFGQCGVKGAEIVLAPTRVSSVTYNTPPTQNVPLHNVVALACGEKHSACVVDMTRSLRDKYVWKLMELLRSLLRSLYAIVELYHLPLKTRHGHNDIRARVPPGATVPFVVESDIASMFAAVEPLIDFTSNLLYQVDEALDTWGPLTSCFAHLFIGILDQTDVISYFDSLPKALATLETICGNNPQFIGYLQECKKFGDTLRKTEPYEEESKDMDLGSLLVEPYFVFERFQKLMEGIKRHTPPSHPDRPAINKALQHLTNRLRSLKDSMIAKDASLGKAPSVRTLNSQLDNLHEYRSTCKHLYKQAKKISNLERSLAEERTTFASLLALLRTCLGADESNLALALEAYSDLERRLGIIDVQNSTRLIDTFSTPLQQFVVDLDTNLPSFTAYKKAADDAYNDYVSNLSKLLHANKQKDGKTDKKAAEAEKEVQQKKRHLDIQAGEFASRLRAIAEKKEAVQWALLRAMRSEAESLAQGQDRAQSLLPPMDALECGLREKVRKEWGQQLAAIVYQEMAGLPTDFASDSDSQILNEAMSKLDEPYVLSGPNPNYVPLVDLLAAPTLAVVNSLISTAEEEQDIVMRNVVRILDAYQKAIPLIKRGITAEVENTTDPGTLFRLNSIATRLMTAYTRQTGNAYLLKTVKPFIMDIITSTQSYEVDPSKATPTDNIEENMTRLLAMSQKMIDTIVRSAPEFPLPLRVLASHLMREVAKKFPTNRQTAVGGFVFLRFIVPAVLAPGAHGLLDNTQYDTSRPLVLISKVLQNLSNGIEFSRELFMLKTNAFITANLEKVRTFFDTVASLPANHPHPPTIATIEQVTAHDLHFIHAILVKNLSKITKSLAQYKHKEAIPELWHVLTNLENPVEASPALLPS